MNLQDIAVLEGKVRHRGEGAVAHDDHVAARELEKTLDISDIFAAAIALPRQTAAEAKLAAEADGNDGADIGEFHENLPNTRPQGPFLNMCCYGRRAAALGEAKIQNTGRVVRPVLKRRVRG